MGANSVCNRLVTYTFSFHSYLLVPVHLTTILYPFYFFYPYEKDT
jgi:hypothetical protein